MHVLRHNSARRGLACRCLPCCACSEGRHSKKVNEAEVRREQPISGRSAHFCGSGDKLLFCQHLLDQLGTRVSHTKGARSRLLDLNDILLPCSFRYYPSLRWLTTQDSSPLPCSASALTWVFPSLPLPISVGVELTFILFSASQRHRAWDICSEKSAPEE
jgi:hypothetical protein